MAGEVADYLVELLREGYDRYYWQELYRGDDKSTVDTFLERYKGEVTRVTAGRGVK